MDTPAWRITVFGNLRVTVTVPTEVKAWKFGNVELNWPKLFQAFFVKVTLVIFTLAGLNY